MRKSLLVGCKYFRSDPLEDKTRRSSHVLLIDANRLTCRRMPLIPSTYPPPAHPRPPHTWHCQHPWAMNECPWWTMNTNMTLRDLNAYPGLISVAPKTSCAHLESASDTPECRQPTPACLFNGLVTNCYFQKLTFWFVEVSCDQEEFEATGLQRSSIVTAVSSTNCFIAGGSNSENVFISLSIESIF